MLALFAKAPVPGQVKTRLVPPLSSEQAAALYEAMLLDIVEQHDRVPGTDRVLWYTPDDAAEWFERVLPPGWELRPQRGDSLAARMAQLFREYAAEGYDRMVLRGTDSPTLPLERIEAAFEALERADLVLCPDRDGGYNSIGLTAPCDQLFELQTSSASLLDETLVCAHSVGLRAVTLEPHYDVDTASDLDRLQGEIGIASAPRTRDWLAAWSPSDARG